MSKGNPGPRQTLREIIIFHNFNPVLFICNGEKLASDKTNVDYSKILRSNKLVKF